MTASLDLRKAHLVRQHGDLLAVYSWINDERALILVPHRRRNAPWYCVAESAAWKYDDPAYMAQQGRVACDVLGIEPSISSCARVIGIINEGLPDLIRMPDAPDPERLLASYGHVSLCEDGREIAAEDIHPERTGVEYG